MVMDLVFIPLSFVGARVAKSLLAKIPESRFRMMVAPFLFLAGLKFFLIP